MDDGEMHPPTASQLGVDSVAAITWERLACLTGSTQFRNRDNSAGRKRAKSRTNVIRPYEYSFDDGISHINHALLLIGSHRLTTLSPSNRYR